MILSCSLFARVILAGRALYVTFPIILPPHQAFPGHILAMRELQSGLTAF